MSLILNVPRINDNLRGFETLFQMWQQVKQNNDDVIFDFSKCDFLRQNAVAFLGGLARLLESQDRKVTFDCNTMRKRIRMNLNQNGFMHIFNSDEKAWKGNSIPYREDKYQDIDGLVYYLSEQWLGRGWIHISDLLNGYDCRNYLGSVC